MGMLKNIKRNIMSIGAIALVVGSFAVAAGVFTPTEANSGHQCKGYGDGRENSSNAIIRNGVCTPSEFLKKYKENKTGDLPAIYKHYGINVNDFKNAKPGVVTRSGDVKVDGKVVAKNAYTMGRTHDNRTGSKKITINGKTYWQRSDNSNQHSTEQAVMVVFDQFGRFKSAIINSCANPLIAVPTKPKPSAVCENVTINKTTTRNRYLVTAKASAKDGAKITGYTFDFGDGTKVKQNGHLMHHTYKKEGTYTVKVTVHTNIGDKTSTNCQGKVTVAPEPTVKVCEVNTGNIVTIKESEFDSKKHSKNLDDCEKITVCEIESGNVIEIRKPQFDSKKHSKDLDDCKSIKVCEVESGKVIEIRKTEFDDKKHSTNLDDCEDIEVCEVETGKIVTIRKTEFDETKHSNNFDDCKTIEVCEVETGKIVEIRKSELDESKHSTDLKDCEEKEVPPVEETPVELPTTGVADTLMQLLGLGAVTASALYYAASATRR